ncbi:substrate-binding periplasmic protein [Vibrio galatheae]|uniref:substrate-binding periplasmic protein n=1 Tax=Vibrio galatheae TaxID=579748 RepID=UPI0005FA4EF5|nr:transporter substrate-binding domain-containing protein [Vibrio galatheae]
MVWKTGPLVLALILLAGFGLHAAPHNNLPHLRICGDAIDWPPYIYVQNEEIHGYDVEILDRALARHGVKYDLVLTSWSRCLRGAKHDEYDLVVSASYSPEREKDYLYTEWYYTITPLYIYSSQLFPQGLTISTSQELSAYRVCGQHSYNYHDFNIDGIESVGNSIREITEKLKTGECDVYLSWEEILEGTRRKWGIEHITPPLVYKAVPNMEPHKFYMLISRHLPEREQLKTLLDRQFRLDRTANKDSQ